jgi:hypothetical protein
MEHTIKQNTIIDIYENYFQDFQPDIIEGTPYVKTINTYRYY